ncbi:MAG TPA: lysozyme [Gemmatimonadales bacterium]
MSRPVPDSALALLREFEGCRLTAYQDVAGVWTIGYGHTGPDVQGGLTITQPQADDLLRADAQKAGDAVLACVSVPLTDGQYGALVSFVYNLGPGALAKSTLLRKLNAGDYAGAQGEFRKWCHAGGKFYAGLLRRRQAEAALFGG